MSTLSLTRFEFLGNSKIDLILHCPFYDYQKLNYGRLRQKCIIVLQLHLIKSTYLLWCLFPVKNKSIFIFNLQRTWDKQINLNCLDKYIFKTYAILSSVSIGTSSDFASPLVASPFSIFPTSGFSASAGKASVATGAALGTFRGINKNSSSTSSSFARSKSS